VTRGRTWALAAGAGIAAAAGAAARRRRRERGPDRHHYRPAPVLGGAWDDDYYLGEATLIADGAEHPVRIHLGGNIQPIDGSYRWYGRVTRDDAVTELHRTGVRDVVIRVPGGVDTAGRLAELDPHGNARVTGTGPPPHPLDDPTAEEFAEEEAGPPGR
jgi:hypothetical protein